MNFVIDSSSCTVLTQRVRFTPDFSAPPSPQPPASSPLPLLVGISGRRLASARSGSGFRAGLAWTDPRRDLPRACDHARDMITVRWHFHLAPAHTFLEFSTLKSKQVLGLPVGVYRGLRALTQRSSCSGQPHGCVASNPRGALVGGLHKANLCC
jgi:hypothetical protein